MIDMKLHLIDFDTIILFVLGLISVRDLLSKNFDIPKDKKWSWLFYNKKECEEVPYCYQLNKIKKNKPPISYNATLLSKLMLVLGNHTKYFEEGAFCDREKNIRVNHLVSTLEASHDVDDLKVMIDVIERLYFGVCDKMNIDFVISLKGGNVLLVDKLVQIHNHELIHITYNRNLFYQSFGIASSNEKDVYAGIGLQFENMDELIRIARLNKRKLNGIVLDCSYSSGNGIVHCVRDFNKVLDDNINDIININPIQEVRVIYSHIGKDIQEQLEECNCNIEYCFSLNDEKRKLLYELIHEESSEENKLINARKILESLKNDKMLDDSIIQ